MDSHEYHRNEQEGSLDHLLVRYKLALAKLKDIGIRIPETSRLRNYERLYEKLLRQPGIILRVDENIANDALFAYREMGEIVAIAESLSAKDAPEVLSRVRLLPKGADSIDDEVIGQARDAQFELMLRSAFVQAGVTVAMGRPDLAVSGDPPYFIEAKRPGSDARVDDRLREAANLLHQEAGFGIAALSLDLVVRKRGEYLRVAAPHELRKVAKRAVDKWRRSNARMFKSRLQGKKVAAVLLLTRIPARLSGSNLTCLTTSIHIEALVSPESEAFRSLSALQAVMSLWDA